MNTIKLANHIATKAGVAQLECHSTGTGTRSVIRYPFDGRKYEVIVNPVAEEPEQ